MSEHPLRGVLSRSSKGDLKRAGVGVDRFGGQLRGKGTESGFLKAIVLAAALIAVVLKCTGGIVDLARPSTAPVVVPAPTLDCSNNNPDPRCLPVPLPAPLPPPKPRDESAPGPVFTTTDRTIVHQYPALPQDMDYVVRLTITEVRSGKQVHPTPLIVHVKGTGKPSRRRPSISLP